VAQIKRRHFHFTFLLVTNERRVGPVFRPTLWVYFRVVIGEKLLTKHTLNFSIILVLSFLDFKFIDLMLYVSCVFSNQINAHKRLAMGQITRSIECLSIINSNYNRYTCRERRG